MLYTGTLPLSTSSTFTLPIVPKHSQKNENQVQFSRLDTTGKQRLNFQMESRGGHHVATSHFASISSFGRLPTEIITEIMMFYLVESRKITRIMHISRRLRRIVLEMAIVWSSIRLLTATRSGNRRSDFTYVNVSAIIFAYAKVFIN
jgi:hypothetical protein